MDEHTGRCRRKESLCKTERHCGVGESANSGTIGKISTKFMWYLFHNKFNTMSKVLLNRHILNNLFKVNYY